jgi:hypothetical protein
MSSSEIARDCGVTRNVVMGHLHRLRQAGVTFPSRRSLVSPVAREKVVRVRRPRREAPRPPAAVPEDLGPALPQTLATIGPRGCRWVLPERRDGLFLMCARPAPPGSSWCRQHRELVFERRTT